MSNFMSVIWRAGCATSTDTREHCTHFLFLENIEKNSRKI